MNTMWTNENEVMINPPCWTSALSFLDTFTYMESEFGIVELVSTGMFDLEHRATAEELGLAKTLRAIRYKSALAKGILRWIVENKETMTDYPDDLA